MVQKYFFIVVLIGCISIVSCRSEDEFNTKDDNGIILEEKILENTENKDSAKQRDSLTVDNDLFIKSDSSKVETIDNPPPVETTHWKNRK